MSPFLVTVRMRFQDSLRGCETRDDCISRTLVPCGHLGALRLSVAEPDVR